MTAPEGQPEACPVEQVERLAHGPADQPVPEDLCRHLEQCAACRARLEAAAAPEIDWVRVRRVLKEQPAKPDAGAAQGGLSFSLLRLLGPSDDPRAVGKIGPFEVTEVIGSGGMGMVLKARDPALDRHVAIKILAPHLASSATARRRFAREARAAAAVIHDHVIAIYQVSEHQELPYLVMPYLPDPSLQQRLDRDGKLDLESALSIGLQVAGGLEAAHAQGLIHRDVKPANVLLAKGTERAIITDFGLARAADDASLTSSGVLAGTPHYMSPEQARGEPVDFRSDLFSLGSLVFAMLTGQPPVNRELGSETIRTIATQPMPPLRTVAADAPEWAERLVGWLHQPKPEDRPESARQVAETLEQCLKHVRSPQAEGLPERLTRAEETEMGHPKDMRLFSLIALGLFLAVFLTPPLLAITTRDEWALAFGGVAACLALFFGCLSWGERISRVVVKTLVSLVVLVGVTFLVFLGIRTLSYSNEVWVRDFKEQERDKAVALQKQREEAEKEKADPKGKDPLSGGGYPGMGGPPGGMAGPGAGMPGGDGPPGLELPGFVSPSTPGMGGPPGMGFGRGGNAGPNNTTFAEELKKALGEELPVPEWKKPKYTPFPQLSGTWIATKAYLNGEEFKSQDKGQGIAMVCFGESIVIRMGRNFNQPELELGSGQIRLVPGGKDKTFMVSGYTMNPNTYTAEPFQRPIFGTLELKGEKLKIAFSENEPALGLGPKKGQDYYEFQAFSQRIPEGLNPILPIQGKKFFCSSVVDWVNFPLLKGIWFCENAQFCREANLNYSKLDPKRFVLTGDGNGLIIYYQAPRQGTTSAEPDVKDRFPKTTWPFWAWSPGGKGPIEVGKLRQFGIGGSEFLNYEIKGNLLHLTVADSIEDLGRNGKYDVFVLKKVEEKWYGEEWQGEKLAKKVEIHAQKSEPMSPPDKSQEKPKDGGKESGKPKEVPAGMGGGGFGGNAVRTFAEELKKALGEELPVPEWKKPKYTPFPQLSGTWIATKAYLNGEEFKGQDKRQGIAMVCYGESIVIRMGRNFNQTELELGSGQIRLVPGGKDKTFMVWGYSSKPNANGYKQSPIFCTYQIDGEKLSIAFSESEPKLGPAKGQDYYEFKAFSQRFPEELDVTQPISGKKFFSSSVGWIRFPLLKGVWFCESAQFSRETSLNYSKLDPKRFVLTGEGNGLVLYFQATRQRARSAEPDVKDGFPATTWRFHSWSPGGKGPIEAGKLPQFGTAGIEYLNYEYKGDLLHLTVADSIEGLGRDGKNDVFVFKKVTENWLEEEWKGEKLEKKLEIHAQKSVPMNPPDMSQEKPKDGGKESGKPKEVPAGMVGGVFGGNAVRTFAEELKKALGEDLPIPEGKKPKYTPFPQLSGTWIATKAYLNGEEFKGQDKGQGIAMVCFGESIVIRMGRNFNQPELELGSGQIRLVPGRKDKTFMVRGYAMKPNANGYKQGPIFCTYQIDGEKLSIAFSESEPKLGPLKGQDYYEFKAFSQRFPEELDVTQPISGKKFFCSAVDWVSFPLLKGIWFSESAQFRREASLNYSKLDPKRLVLMGYGDELRIYFEVPNLGTRDGGVEPKGRFPRTIWLFHSWSPGEKGPIQAGKISQGTAGLEFLNYEYKGDLLHLTVADSIGGLGPDGKNDTFLFKKITEDPWLEELKVKNLEEKLKIHAQKSDPINPADMSQEEPKDGGKEPGKPKEVPAGKEPVKAADGKEKGK